jgi:hypothetical protein
MSIAFAFVVACGARTAVELPGDVASVDASSLPDAGLDAPRDTPLFCQGILTVSFVPTARAQFAVWVEAPTFTTLALTAATARHGIGNRPGAMQMNSGYRWPVGRRESVLPGWAGARLRSGASPFRRVVFSERGEGICSADPLRSIPDPYSCLSFHRDDSSRDGLDAVSCASSVFHGDPGRFLTPEDVAAGYAEPFELPDGTGILRALDLGSPYPPRRDLPTELPDHPDAANFAAHALEVMPELDAITMATPTEGERITLTYEIPPDWHGGVSAYVEIHTEGDYFGEYGPARLPTPSAPGGAWDYWAQAYGYPYRGQPSVLFEASLAVPPTDRRVPPLSREVVAPSMRGTLDGSMDMIPMDGTIADDPTALPGSGADRLQLLDGARMLVTVEQRCD